LDLDFSLDSTSLFDINSFDMSFVSIKTPGNTKSLSNYRVLEGNNRNLSSNNRILSGNKYGEISQDIFSIDSQEYGAINFDPHANKQVDTFVKKADDELTDLMVHEEFQIMDQELSLTSVNDFVLPDKVILFEEAVTKKVMNDPEINVFKDSEVEQVQAATTTVAYNAQQEADNLIRRMSGSSYYNRFIDLRIFGTSNDPELAKAKGEKANERALQLCYKEFEDYRKAQTQYLAHFKSALTTTECLMVFIARSILQSENYQNGGFNYFNLLDAGYNMNSMNDVFDMIAVDRNATATFGSKMVTFEQYYQMYNRILI